MLGASVVMLVLVSTFVAFGSWPGSDSGKRVDQVVLNDVTASAKAKPKAVRVRADAVQVARRAEARRQVAAVRRGGSRTGGTRTRSNTPGTSTLPGGDTVAQVPAAGGKQGAATLPSTPTSPTQQIQNTTQQTQQTIQNTTDAVQNTTTQVTNQVQQQVQDTTQQVGEVVDQVVGGTQQTTSTTVDTVTNTVGGILGK
jgi:gas vesicle protein